MGFLIFAYRKLFLKRKVNDLNFQAMVLSQKKQTITQQISLTQEAMSNSKNLINMLSSSSMASIQSNVYSEYFQKNGNGMFDPSKRTEAYAKADANEIQMMASQRMQTEQARVMMTNAFCGSVFDAVDKAQLTQLNMLDSQISMQIANIDSQTKQLMPELESVEKAESEAAKSEAPKFGLG